MGNVTFFNSFIGDYNDLNNKPFIPSKTSDLTNDSGFITADDIPRGENGENGETPYIGFNGNWWIGDTDTGVPVSDPIRVPVTITARMDDDMLPMQPLSIQAVGSDAQRTQFDEFGEFKNSLKTETKYVFNLLQKSQSDEILPQSKTITTGTMDIPLSIEFLAKKPSNNFADIALWESMNTVISANKGILSNVSIDMLTVYTPNSYCGAILAPNGKIYGIPYGSITVSELDPETRTVSTFGSLPNTACKWYGGVLAPNGKIYGIPYDASTVLEIDPETRTVSTFGSLPSTLNKYIGGVLAPNGKIYCMPRYALNVLEIDPETQTISTFGSFSGDNFCCGGVLAKNGKIYGIPYTSKVIYEIDPIARTVTSFGSLSGSVGWSGGVLAPNGKIYGIPSISTVVLEIDPETRTVSTFGSLSATTYKWSGSILASNGKIYGMPYSSNTIFELDPETRTISFFGNFGDAGFKWGDGVLAPNGKIYGIPCNATTIFEVSISDELINFPKAALLSAYINKL